MKSKKVYVVGSTNQDIVVQLDKRPAIGETVFGKRMSYFQGGKGANQAIACHKIGGDTVFVSMIGEDAFGHALKQEFEDKNLPCRLLVSPSSATGAAVIFVDNEGNNSITVISGSNLELTIEQVQGLMQDSSAGDILLIQNELAADMIAKLLSLAKSKGLATIVNVAPAADIRAELKNIDYLILNEHEIETTLAQPALSVTDIKAAQETVKHLSDLLNINLIVTIGEKGVIAHINGELFHIEGRKVSVVDTTGAGDCFCGAFAGCLSQNMPVAEALRCANIAASLSVQSLGASTSYPSFSEVKNC